MVNFKLSREMRDNANLRELIIMSQAWGKKKSESLTRIKPLILLDVLTTELQETQTIFWFMYVYV